MIMTDELKPVNCGCGGEAKIDKHTYYRALPTYGVRCHRCGQETRQFYMTEAEAVTAWNKAMSDEERTAKVIDKSVGRHSISDFDWTGKCEKCGNEIQFSFDYCPYCGSRLEWE